MILEEVEGHLFFFNLLFVILVKRGKEKDISIWHSRKDGICIDFYHHKKSVDKEIPQSDTNESVMICLQ